MRVHPEMKEAMNTAMTEGLTYWRDLTPSDIEKRLRARMLADQKALKTCQFGLGWKYERTPCACPSSTFTGTYHLPWCNGVKKIVFIALNKPTGHYRYMSNWLDGSIPANPTFLSDVPDEEDL